ncbi:uncharacterized protein LOC112091446 isoform X2 [Morus notabilis]|uniref:uncharacterized protein LOC112091446 isoform X2 n=1 Tax=Morus notabilis TaxID=981085 RepID=UPI000CECF55E|nr:uncharacterized protein LOC112091446 isoform X2 [Morus notabilis]
MGERSLGFRIRKWLKPFSCRCSPLSQSSFSTAPKTVVTISSSIVEGSSELVSAIEISLFNNGRPIGVSHLDRRVGLHLLHQEASSDFPRRNPSNSCQFSPGAPGFLVAYGVVLLTSFWLKV